MSERGQSPAPSVSGRWSRGFEKGTAIMNSLATIWIFVLLIVVNLDIGGRAIFNHPIRGVPEVVSMSITALVFLQIAHTIGVGRLTRSEVFLGWLLKKQPRAGLLLDALFCLVGAALFLIILWASYPLFSTAWTISEYVGAEGDFKAPTWPVKLVVIIGCVAGIVQFLLMAWQRIEQFAQASRTTPVSGGRPS